VSCDAAKAWLEENTQQASLDDESLKAVREMEELKRLLATSIDWLTDSLIQWK
jgi:hypothetical protein